MLFKGKSISSLINRVTHFTTVEWTRLIKPPRHPSLYWVITVCSVIETWCVHGHVTFLCTVSLPVCCQGEWWPDLVLVQPQIVAIGTVLEQYRHCVGRTGQVRLGMAGGVDTSEWVAVVGTMSEWSLSCLVQYAIHVHECSCRMEWECIQREGFVHQCTCTCTCASIYSWAIILYSTLHQKKGRKRRKKATNKHWQFTTASTCTCVEIPLNQDCMYNVVSQRIAYV